MIDAVLSFHMNPWSCGVCKFNIRLAKELGVPCLPHTTTSTYYPLVSIKPAEMPCPVVRYWGRYLVLLHDRTLPADSAIIRGADHVWYADQIGCPSTLDGNPLRGTVNILLFGMSHKIDVHTVYVERLRDLLAGAQVDYTISVSTAVHEGSPWDGAFTQTVEHLRKTFGPHLRVLGYLADDALAKELSDCSAVALFFDPAARANNTTIWAALEAGAPLITNLDRESPPELVHGETVFALHRLVTWPTRHELRAVRTRGPAAAAGRGWAPFLRVLQTHDAPPADRGSRDCR